MRLLSCIYEDLRLIAGVEALFLLGLAPYPFCGLGGSLCLCNFIGFGRLFGGFLLTENPWESGRKKRRRYQDEKSCRKI